MLVNATASAHAGSEAQHLQQQYVCKVLKHNMYKNMCERALQTAGNLDGDNDAEPIYAKHVTK
jgi:hypothetical protein